MSIHQDQRRPLLVGWLSIERSAKKMRLLQSLLILTLLGLIPGCGEPLAELSTPKTHHSGTITFDYPKNWRITEDSVTSAIHSLFIETPGDAVVIFQSYPTKAADDLATFSKAFSDTAATETPMGTIVRTTFADIPDADGYEWIEEKFNINLLGESVPHRRFYGTKEMGDRKIFLIFQVATEDFKNTEAGFHLVRRTLREAKKTKQEGSGPPAASVESK